jgi:hypothetical protein
MLQGYSKLTRRNRSAIASAIARSLASRGYSDTAGLPHAAVDVHHRRTQSPVSEPSPRAGAVAATRCLGRRLTTLPAGRSPRSAACPSRVASLGGVLRWSRHALTGDPSSHASIEREREGERICIVKRLRQGREERREEKKEKRKNNRKIGNKYEIYYLFL